jgi:cyclopropane-fatty-acyl-phospholipid synthase
MTARWRDWWLEHGVLPDWMIRAAIRHIVAARLREQEQGGPAAQARRRDRFLEDLHSGPIALETAAANAQHYEVASDFYELVLGPHLKYSAGLWEHDAATLADAERAMLDLVVERAGVGERQHVLDLGCGWGSFLLYAAARFPSSRFVGLTNSRSQREFILARAGAQGLDNIEVVAGDINVFEADRQFDRIVSIEMFEHVRNYEQLLQRIAGWMHADARLFVHVFAHARFAYPYEVRGESDWMAEHFFTGGTMPSDTLLLEFRDHVTVVNRWRLQGTHYARTADAWLQNMDRQRDAVMAIFQRVYGSTAGAWWHRWRIFFMACAELFAYRNGQEWGVSHYVFRRT